MASQPPWQSPIRFARPAETLRPTRSITAGSRRSAASLVASVAPIQSSEYARVSPAARSCASGSARRVVDDARVVARLRRQHERRHHVRLARVPAEKSRSRATGVSNTISLGRAPARASRRVHLRPTSALESRARSDGVAPRRSRARPPLGDAFDGRRPRGHESVNAISSNDGTTSCRHRAPFRVPASLLLGISVTGRRRRECLHIC